jgi:hypothetical protein
VERVFFIAPSTLEGPCSQNVNWNDDFVVRLGFRGAEYVRPKTLWLQLASLLRYRVDALGLKAPFGHGEPRRMGFLNGETLMAIMDLEHNATRGEAILCSLDGSLRSPAQTQWRWLYYFFNWGHS